ncbi:MAG: acyl-CoA dehydrogenase family protein [Dehalococcoidia bacterium]
MTELAPHEQEFVEITRRWVDEVVRPTASELEHDNAYPEALIEDMKEMGVFGLVVPEEYGGADVSTSCFARVTEELARGWMSLAGAMGSHSVVARLIRKFGTPDQQSRYLPRMATGEVRAAMALTEPGGGSDLQAMTTVARRTPDGYLINGTKTWITNARRGGLIALLCKTDPTASPAHEGISLLLVEKGPGLTVSRDLPKLGYRGVESCEIAFADYVTPTDSLLGEAEGRGFAQMMHGLELGRVQVASRAVGVAQAAFDDAFTYAQQRESFGRPIWQHQSIGNHLADMATVITASRLLVLDAARRIDAGSRADMEAGMAKLFASEACLEVTTKAMRIHGGYGYSTEFDVERYFRDAPLMIIGEGTNEIQKSVIARQLISRGGM